MSNQSSCQTVSQDSYLITLLVNTWSATLHIVACHRVSQDSYLILSNHSAGQREISQFVKQSVKTVTCYLISQLVNKTSDQPVCQTVSQDSYLITLLVNKWSASLSNSQSRQLSIFEPLSWSTTHQLVCQTVSLDSYLITQLVNKASASLSNSHSRQLSNHYLLVNKWLAWLSSRQSRQLSNNSAVQQVISQFVKRSVETVM